MNYYGDEIPVMNVDGETAPPYCLLASTGEIDTATNALKVKRAGADSMNGLCVNSQVSIAPGETGVASYRVREIISYSGDDPADGGNVGSKAGEWYAAAGKLGFVVIAFSGGVANAIRVTGTPVDVVTPPDPTPATYNCVNGNCIEAADGKGQFVTLLGCLQSCGVSQCGDPPPPPPPPPPPTPIPGYDCVLVSPLEGFWECQSATTGSGVGGVVDAGRTAGRYATLADCRAAGCYNARLTIKTECSVTPCGILVNPQWYDPYPEGYVALPVTGTIDWGDGSAPTPFGVIPPVPSHTYPADGTYTVTVTATDANGRTIIGTQQVTVYCGLPPPPPPPPPIPVHAGIGVLTVSGCDVSVVMVVGGGGTGPYTFTVDWGDGSAPTVAGPGTLTHTYPAAGGYFISWSVADSSTPPMVSSGVVRVDVVDCSPPLRFANIGVSYGGACSITLSLEAANGTPPYSYVINWGDGQTSTVGGGAGATATNHTYAGSGAYPISVTVTDSGAGPQTASTNTVATLIGC